MAIIILLNVVFAAFVVVAILTLLGWGIASGHPQLATIRRRTRTAHTRRQAVVPRRQALRHGS